MEIGDSVLEIVSISVNKTIWNRVAKVVNKVSEPIWNLGWNSVRVSVSGSVENPIYRTIKYSEIWN